MSWSSDWQSCCRRAKERACPSAQLKLFPGIAGDAERRGRGGPGPRPRTRSCVTVRASTKGREADEAAEAAVAAQAGAAAFAPHRESHPGPAGEQGCPQMWQGARCIGHEVDRCDRTDPGGVVVRWTRRKAGVPAWTGAGAGAVWDKVVSGGKLGLGLVRTAVDNTTTACPASAEARFERWTGVPVSTLADQVDMEHGPLRVRWRAAVQAVRRRGHAP